MLLLNKMKLFLLMLMIMKDHQNALMPPTIPKFEPHKFSWAQVGNLTHAMASAHRAMAGQSASVVNMEDAKKFSA